MTVANNKRIFYACQAVAIAGEGAASTIESGNMVHGAQSIGLTTNFNLEQAFELSQIEIYENIEGTPDVEVTMEKLLDGYPLMYHMATTGVVGTSQSGLAARSDVKCDVHLAIYDASANNVAGAATDAEVEVYCSGMFVSNVSYTIPVDGNSTESITLVGNNKQWLTGANTNIVQADVGSFDGTDRPKALPQGLDQTANAGGGVQRREDVILAGCILPTSINGVAGSDYGNALAGDGTPIVHIQNFTCSVDLGREDILELGRKTPYFRPANFPVEVTCEFEAITTSGDFVSAYEFGDSALYTTEASGNNLADENIFMLLRAGYGFDMGNKNKLSSISYGGGDAGGGNATCSYSYSNFNQFDVQAYNDQELIGFGGITKGLGFDGNGLALSDGGTNPHAAFPADLVN